MGYIERIVVMGGSFNPPTVAHYKLMKDAMNVVNADLGIFVPVSDAYLEKKMRYSKHRIVLPPRIRISMLNYMCDDDMCVCNYEVDTPWAKSITTLNVLKEAYPEAEIYFVIGDDKLRLLNHLVQKKQFVENYKVLLYTRNDRELDLNLSKLNIPSDYMSSILISPQLEGMADVSSSLIRQRLMEGKSCEDLLFPGSWQILGPYLAESKRRFKDIYKERTPAADSIDYVKQILLTNPDLGFVYFWGHTPSKGGITKSCLSQWYDVKFEVKGVVYHTAEQYMMARKALMFGDKETYDEIMQAKDPREYKMLGRKIKNFDGNYWDSRKFHVVYEANYAKFSQNPELKEFLLSTGHDILAEASPYDKIWGIGLNPSQAREAGVDQWQGQNLLGFVLMSVRNNLREEDNERM